MTKEPLSGDQSDEITVFIQVPRVECNELFSFLNSNGVKAVKSFGVQNSIPVDIDAQNIAEIAKNGTPYLMVYGVVKIMASAFNAYAETHKKEIKVIKPMQGGIEVTAKNFGVQELKEMGVVDLIKFAPLSDDEEPPLKPENSEGEMGFHVGMKKQNNK
jgi:hypothetical protein